MRTAPAVSVTAYPPAWAACAVLLLCAAAIVTALAWAAQGGSAWRYAAALVGVAVAIAWFAPLRGRPPSRLRWDGAAWRLGSARPQDDGVEGEVTLAIDGGERLLVRFVPSGRRRAVWLPLQRDSVEGDWHLLRCALHSPRGAPLTPASGALDA